MSRTRRRAAQGASAAAGGSADSLLWARRSSDSAGTAVGVVGGIARKPLLERESLRRPGRTPSGGNSCG